MSQTMQPPAQGGTMPSGPHVAVTIVDNGDGTFMVYAGDEPDGAESGDMSGDDADAMGDAGDMPAPQGQSADSAGAALKIAMDILQGGGVSGGDNGTPADQFAAGFGGGSSSGASPSMAQKY